MTPISNQYARVNRSTKEIVAWFLQPEPPLNENEYHGYEKIEPHFSFSTSPPPSPSHRLYFRDGAVVWEDTLKLDDIRAKYIAKTYEDVDDVYEKAVGRRTTEYARAEEAAREYLAADPKPTVVSGYITGHAERNSTGVQQTNEWAAQQIVERADAFKWAELQMRNVRFARQADMRAATTGLELQAAAASWQEFITWLHEVLGI